MSATENDVDSPAAGTKDHWNIKFGRSTRCLCHAICLHRQTLSAGISHQAQAITAESSDVNNTGNLCRF